MLKKSLTALALAYLTVVVPPVLLGKLFANSQPPSDSYLSNSGFHQAIVIKLTLLGLIFLLFKVQKRLTSVLRVNEVAFFHFLLYLGIYHGFTLFYIVLNANHAVFYNISGARKIKSTNYGYIYPPNSQRQEELYADDTLLLKASYSFDSVGRRKTINRTAKKTRAVLFFGCSFTYGDGVSDSETLPSQYANLDSNSTVFNYVLDGWGPQQSLQLLSLRNLSSETQTDTAIGIYVWIDDHLQRASLFKSHYVGWTHSFPCFLLQKDSLVYKGSFESYYKWRGLFFELLNHSVFFDAIDIPKTVSDKDYKLSAAIIAKCKNRFATQFERNKFVVFIYPGSSKRITTYLDEYHIPYILGNDNLLTEKDYFPKQGHPKAFANKKLATFLISNGN